DVHAPARARQDTGQIVLGIPAFGLRPRGIHGGSPDAEESRNHDPLLRSVLPVVLISPRGFAPRTPLHARSRGPRRPRSARVGSLARSFASRTGFKPIAGGRERGAPRPAA